MRGSAGLRRGSWMCPVFLRRRGCEGQVEFRKRKKCCVIREIVTVEALEEEGPASDFG